MKPKHRNRKIPNGTVMDRSKLSRFINNSKAISDGSTPATTKITGVESKSTIKRLINVANATPPQSCPKSVPVVIKNMDRIHADENIAIKL
jgi:hypothetical protein